MADRASIELTLIDGPPATPWGSKVGGLPYLVPAADHPLDEAGNPLVFIAQLNFSELPDLLGFPTTGLLQFFISSTAEFDCVVIYHPAVPTIWERPPGQLPAWQSPPSTSRAPQREFTPLENPDAEFGLIGKLVNQPDPDYEEDDEDLGGHRIGGFPYGNSYPEIPDGHVLLFQLDSDAHDDEWRIMWGDLGTGRFTISTLDLVQRDFSAVQYDWDCA